MGILNARYEKCVQRAGFGSGENGYRGAILRHPSNTLFQGTLTNSEEVEINLTELEHLVGLMLLQY